MAPEPSPITSLTPGAAPAQYPPMTLEVQGQPQPQPQLQSPDVTAQVQPEQPQSISVPNLASPRHGSMWQNILLGALSGLAAGARAPNGSGFAGGAGMGAGAAIQGQQERAQFAQQQAAQKQRMAQEQQEAQDRHSAYAANAQLSQIQLAQEHDKLTQMGNGLTDEATKNLQAMGDVLSAGGEKVGYGTETELINSVPDAAKGFANGTLRFFPDPANPGKFYAYRVPEGWLDQTNTQPLDIQVQTGVDAQTGQPTYIKRTIPAGAITNGNYLNLNAALTKNGLAAQAKIAGAKIAAGASKANATVRANATVKAAGIRAAATKSNNDAANGGNMAALVDEVGTGHIAPERMSYLITRNPQLLAQVSAKYPDFDSSKAASYPQVYKDYTSTQSGHAGGALLAGATALNHLYELQQLNTAGSHMGAFGIGGPSYTAYRNKVQTVASELARFYGHETDQSVKGIQETLLSTLPGDRDAAIRTQAQSMIDRLKNYEQAWRNAAPSSVYEAPMPHISSWSMADLRHFDPNFQWMNKADGPGAGTGAAPAPQTHVFSASAWLKANPGGNIAAAQQAATAAGYKVVQ